MKKREREALAPPKILTSSLHFLPGFYASTARLQNKHGAENKGEKKELEQGSAAASVAACPLCSHYYRHIFSQFSNNLQGSSNG